MACEKYSKLIAHEALGGLTSEPGAALRGHLAKCVSCQNEFVRAKNLADAVSAGVEMLVAGEPLPQFAARVRARIANESGPARLDWRAWIPVSAGSLVLAIILMALMIRTPRSASREGVTLGQIPGHSEIVVPARTESSATEGGPMAIRSTHRTVQPRQPEVLVLPGQLVAVMQLANALNTRHIEIEQTVAPQEQSGQPIEIEAIQIAPLKIAQLDNVSDPPETSGGF